MYMPSNYVLLFWFGLVFIVPEGNGCFSYSTILCKTTLKSWAGLAMY